MADATRMSAMLDIVENRVRSGQMILVCSAISGCTDALLSRDRERILEFREKHRKIISRLFSGKDREEAAAECDSLFDEILDLPPVIEAFGEILSTKIIARRLGLEGINALWVDSRRVIVKDDERATFKNVSEFVGSHPEVQVFVAPGFIASDGTGAVTTLGRGGSDYSAALYAAGSGAENVEIWTDVPGIMTANPKEVEKAFSIPKLSYDAAFNMADHGAKVLYPPTVSPAKEAGIPIVVKDSFHPAHPGTVISAEKCSAQWIGVTRTSDTLCLVCEGCPDRDETASRLAFALSRINLGIENLRFENGYMTITVPESLGVQALQSVHREFFELEDKNLRLLYIAGKGAVGTALREMIESTAENIRKRSGKTLRIVAQADSSNPDFCKDLVEQAPDNAIFVDCTDSEDIYRWYVPLLEKGISIVSSNRRSLAIPYSGYAAMKRASLRSGAFLRYETTVGAALPILESIALSANSNDEITSIEAVVSCTLNYILSSSLPFGEALKKAQEIGLTEKDPKQDLEGRDALRKLLILSREAGVPLDEEDVEIEPVRDLESIGQNQRFVASITKDDTRPLGYRAAIRLQIVSESHPAYWLKGTDNAIIVRSTFHPSPLVIQGAGEGAKMAASSILNDILK